MGKIKGQMEWKRLQKGEKLTRNQAIKALCYECNGFEDANHDCGCKRCAIYQFSPYKGKK